MSPLARDASCYSSFCIRTLAFLYAIVETIYIDETSEHEAGEKGLKRLDGFHAPRVAVSNQAIVVGLVANLGAIGQGHDRRLECGPTGRALAGGVCYRIRRVPNPEQFVEYQLVGIDPRGARAYLPHGGALVQPCPDILVLSTDRRNTLS